MSRTACFGIGLIFSGGLSFSILENIRDRRCLYVKDKNKENYLIYKSQLKELLKEVENSQYKMSGVEMQLVEKSRIFTKFIQLSYQTAHKYINDSIGPYMNFQLMKELIGLQNNNKDNAKSDEK